MLTERGMVFTDPGYRLADRAGHTGSSTLWRGRCSSIATAQAECAGEFSYQEVALKIGLGGPFGVAAGTRLIDVIFDLGQVWIITDPAAGLLEYFLGSVDTKWKPQVKPFRSRARRWSRRKDRRADSVRKGSTENRVLVGVDDAVGLAHRFLELATARNFAATRPHRGPVNR
jgi:hypothetical protein